MTLKGVNYRIHGGEFSRPSRKHVRDKYTPLNPTFI